ncbi:hypothetical protein PHA51_07560 [Rodentibacter pneumotropicus]|uniref:Uncharacterized protein n=1 Tax=Rodentibacter pneumotropicus TaxID=758 RepID=A0A4S2PNH0_9PAST|nr:MULTISPECIES: hypothetical protein [Rodentibacter]MCX2960962.1 hypothetical protein [Rodentibacter heylii]MDC2825884.1 hypothetical protein [Rodentibacter pneumotropicus]THA05188.1 hypothetical protein D3M78_12105 [Rodentibacter pneumotropicus]
MSSSIFPRTIEQVMSDYQEELENWVMSAPIEDIRDFFITIHGGVYPDDWEDFVSRHQSNSSLELETIFSCEACRQLLLAIQTTDLSRKELKSFFIKNGSKKFSKHS